RAGRNLAARVVLSRRGRMPGLVAGGARRGLSGAHRATGSRGPRFRPSTAGLTSWRPGVLAFQISDPGQPRLEAVQTLCAGPQVHRERGETVDFGNRARVQGQVDRFDVAMAALAGLDADPGMALALK